MRKRRCFIRGQMHRLRRSRCKKSEIRHGFHFFYYIFSIGCTWVLVCRGRRRRRPAKKHKVAFPLSYFCVTKSTKSHQRERSPLFENSSRVHELVARAVRDKCVRQRAKVKSAVLPLPAISYYHACEHITRGSRADSCTHCLHARNKCKAGVTLICALTGWKAYLLFCLLVVLGLCA